MTGTVRMVVHRDGPTSLVQSSAASLGPSIVAQLWLCAPSGAREISAAEQQSHIARTALKSAATLHNIQRCPTLSKHMPCPPDSRSESSALRSCAKMTPR